MGARVVVPWQGSVRIGLCLSIDEGRSAQSFDLREVISWLDDEPFLTAAAPALLHDLAGYSGTPAGVVLASLSPHGFHDELIHEIRVVPGARGTDLEGDAWLPADMVTAERLDHLRQHGQIFERASVAPRLESRLVALSADDYSSLQGAPQANQRIALELLQGESFPSAAELARTADVPVSAVRALVRKGLAAYHDLAAPPPDLPLPEPSAEPLPDTLVTIPAAKRVTLIGGVRLERLAALLPLLRRELRQGLTPLILAPELAWLDEAAAALQHELPVVRLAGALPDAARERIWQEVRTGPPVVLLGTYLALLAPLRQPGSLIVLEAGSSSYKQPSGARLFIPGVATRLAALEQRPLLFADVCETAEMHAAETTRVQLPYRKQRLFVSDMNQSSGWPLGTDLVQVLRQVRERERQALILSPRRGFSGALTCSSCQQQCMCPHCDLPLRYHQRDRILRCHQCNHHRAVPGACPDCGGTLKPTRAAGTQWISEAAQGVLPDFPVYRFDSDRQDDLTPLRQGRPGVLVATTSALRQPPLPDVSLVVLALLDSHTAAADFRAEEDTLRLLLQLPEVTRRARPLTLVQTFSPTHRALEVLQATDPEEAISVFISEIVSRRKAFGYPPHSHLAKIQITARQQGTAELAAERLVDTLRSAGVTEAEVLGPAPAPVARVRGQYLQLAYVRAESEQRFRELLQLVPRNLAGARVRLDADPRDVTLLVD